ncbi:MAG: hypothetical protein C0593_08280 [Marinilabiliales bacterium]|nr:MAG: hypothetical protein C0593_08280 [Marinilabiliales bacterium]
MTKKTNHTNLISHHLVCVNAKKWEMLPMPGKVFFERLARQPKNKTPPGYKPNGILLYIVIDLSGFEPRPVRF